MTQTSNQIVFFGSGPVAAKSLELLAQNFVIEYVITKPRPAHHKGSVPVIEIAEHLNLPILQAANKAELSALIAEQQFKSRVAILIDFGIIVEQKVIDTFPLGIINSHFSLLPEWRGADPITFSVLSGQQNTGISLMLLVEAMDEGPLLAQSEYHLTADITTPRLTEDLIELSYESLKTIVPLYLDGSAHPAPQEEVTLATSIIPTYSRKLSKKDSTLDWNKPAVQLEREIRAFSEWPKSRTTLGSMECTITKSHVVDIDGIPGTITMTKKELVVYTGDKSLAIDELIPSGKKNMSIQSFLAGYRSLL